VIVDLTHPITDGMQTFPVSWHPRVALQTLGRFAVEGRATTQITLGSHTGTHIDAPSHFIADGPSLSAIALERLVGPASLLDLSHVGERHPVSAEELEAATAGRRLASRVVISFGWARRFDTPSFYDSCPYLTEAAAEWLVATGIELLGYDTPMPDDPRNGAGSDCDSPIHKYFLSRGIPLLEYLANLDQLPGDFRLIALPLRLEGVDGSPVRCVAEVGQ